MERKHKFWKTKKGYCYPARAPPTCYRTSLLPSPSHAAACARAPPSRSSAILNVDFFNLTCASDVSGDSTCSVVSFVRCYGPVFSVRACVCAMCCAVLCEQCSRGRAWCTTNFSKGISSDFGTSIQISVNAHCKFPALVGN